MHPYPVTDAANPVTGIKFRNMPISPAAIKAVTKQLSSAGATCWGSAGQGSFAVSTFRANVLSLMPKQYDSQGKWTGKYIVNSAELPANSKHTVTLREKTGNSAIQTAGATLFLVYRLLDPTEPLRKIVVYDGLYTAYGVGVTSSAAEADTMTQRLRGFYKSAGTSARITHVVGTGGNNQTEKITVTSTPPKTITLGPPPNSADPFPQTSPNSDRSWANPTYNLGTLQNPFMPGVTNDSDRYGETVTTTVSASNTTPAACRAWTAVFFSTQVADVDHDGLPDAVEDAPGGLKDPNDAELPNLNAMGAASTHRDLFVEYNAMWAAPGTTYGSVNAPYPNTTAACYNANAKSCTDDFGHHHFLTPEDIKRIGDRYKAHNITLHVDVGSVSAYHGLGVVQHTDWVDDYTLSAGTNDEYLVGNGVGPNVATLARGGEVVKEKAPPQFATRAIPTAFSPTTPEPWAGRSGTSRCGMRRSAMRVRNSILICRTRTINPLIGQEPTQSIGSDSIRERRPYFHYALGAHTRGTPSSPLPCLAADGQPAGYPPNSTTCAAGTDNPQFHVPSGSRGLSDLPGRNVLLSLGLWDEFVGRPFAREGALFHELGHNQNLWHSGRPAQFGNATTATVIYPNCSPIFLSSMSYPYSIHGSVRPGREHPAGLLGPSTSHSGRECAS